jgi:hypothetical protein
MADPTISAAGGRRTKIQAMEMSGAGRVAFSHGRPLAATFVARSTPRLPAVYLSPMADARNIGRNEKETAPAALRGGRGRW